MATATDVQTLTREILYDLRQGAQKWANGGDTYLFRGKWLELIFCTLGPDIVVNRIGPVPAEVLAILKVVKVYASTPDWVNGSPSYFDHDGYLRIECQLLPIRQPVGLRFDLPTE